MKGSFYKKLERAFDKFPEYHTIILLGEFNSKVGREDILKPTIGNKSLHEISNDNGVNFAKSKNMTVESTTFPHRKIHKFTLTFPDGKTRNQIDHILIDRRRHLIVLDVRSFRAADCDTDLALVVAKVRERLAMSKQTTHRFHMERFILMKINEVRVKGSIVLKFQIAAFENLDTEVDVNKASETNRENTKFSAKDRLGYYELKKHKPRFDEGYSKLSYQMKQAKLQWL
jgi:hypothetical protein